MTYVKMRDSGQELIQVAISNMFFEQFESEPKSNMIVTERGANLQTNSNSN